MPSYQVDNFSLGMTDDLFSGRVGEVALIQNQLVTSDNKLLTRAGSVVDDVVNALNPVGTGSGYRLGTLHLFDSTLLQRIGSKIFFNDSGYTTISGPTGNDAIPGATVANNVALGRWHDHLFLASNYLSVQKIFRNSSGVLQVRSAGLPEYTGTPVLTPNATGSNSYLYKFVYKYTYTAGGVDSVTFIDRGTPRVSLTTTTNAAIGGGGSVAITAITYPSNSTTDNWDTANVIVEIYRTKANLTTFYLLTTLAAGVTLYNDSITDDTLDNGELLYTEGGVFENDAPPKSKFIHVVNDVCFYANLIEDGEKHKNRIRQSKPGDLDSVPLDFSDDVEDEITGISSYKSNVIVFGLSHVYRLDGRIDSLGRGELTHELISDITGCINHDSIVQTQVGVFFAGSDGFYVTDGYTVKKISDNLNTTYAAFTDTSSKRSKIQGKWEAKEERVWWTIQYSTSGSDNDACIVLDTRKGISARSWFAIQNGTSFGPSAIEFDGGTLYRGHYFGFLFRHQNIYFSDPKIEFILAPSNWGTETILFNVRDCSQNFGTNEVRKFISRTQVCARNDGNLSLQLSAYNDGTAAERVMKPINFIGGFVWGDKNFTWGDANCVWNNSKVVEEWRHLPHTGLRCEYFQLEIKNAEVILQNSDDFGNATVDAVAGTVTLDDTSLSWISESNDYFISFEDDNYDTQFLITRGISDTVLQLASVSGLPIAGSYKWQIRGKQKGQILNLINFVVPYSLITDTQTPYSGETGANA